MSNKIRPFIKSFYNFEIYLVQLLHDSTVLRAVLKMNSIHMCLYLLELLWKAKKWKVTEVEHAII